VLGIENEQEEDGRWIAEIPALPGVLAYGSTKADANAKAKAQVPALRVIADRLEKGEGVDRSTSAHDAVKETQ
jgi:predicted RNase H-like HicB family nuclease